MAPSMKSRSYNFHCPCCTLVFLAVFLTLAFAEMVPDHPICSDVVVARQSAVNSVGTNIPGFSHQEMHRDASVGHALLQLQTVRHGQEGTYFIEQQEQHHEQQHERQQEQKQQQHQKYEQLLPSNIFSVEMEPVRQATLIGVPSSVFPLLGIEPDWPRTAGVCVAVLVLCLFITALKYGIDYYEDQLWQRRHEYTPWYASADMQLKVCLSALLIWIAVGMFVFTQVVHFNTAIGDNNRMLSLIEAAYLCTQILTTVGYGDYTPTNWEGQLFVACFVMIGVVVIAVVFTEVLKIIIQRGERAVAKAVGFKEADILGDDETNAVVVDDSFQESGQSWASLQMFNYLNIRHQNFVNFVFSVGPFVLSLAVGTFFFSIWPGESKTPWQAFYMSCITLTSVGFGAFTPATKGGELFASLWMLVGVGATAHMIVCFGDWFFYSRKSLQAYHVGHELLSEMDSDSSDTLDRCDYLRFELIRSGLCQKDDIDEILLRFKMLDPNNRGIHIDHLRGLHEETRTGRGLRVSGNAAEDTQRQNFNTGSFFSSVWRSRQASAADSG